MKETLLQLGRQADRITRLEEENENLRFEVTGHSAQIKIISEEKQVLQATIQELEVRVEELEARVDYVEAFTRKDGKQLWYFQRAVLPNFKVWSNH
jgi:phage shock protein A